MGALGGHLWRGKLDERVIHGAMEELVCLKGRYSESIMLISLLQVCQEWGSFMGVLGECLGFLTGH